MGLMEKAMAAATEAAIRAKEAAEELQTRRELGQAQGDLGRRAFELIESGEISSPTLEPLAERVRALKAQLEGTPEATEAAEPDATTATNGVGEPPATPTV